MLWRKHKALCAVRCQLSIPIPWERYHAVIRRLFNRVKLDHASITDVQALDIALKALNDTMGVVGLSPTFFVYDLHPKLPLTDAMHSNLTHTEHHLTQKAARNDPDKVVDEQKLKIASQLNHFRWLVTWSAVSSW